MDPATPTAAVRCPVDGCEYHPNVADAALAAMLLSIHAQSLHVATPAPAPSYTAGATARVEKSSRPTVDEGVSLEDWLYFEQRSREYKNATRITGLDLTYQLLDCCNPDGLRKNLVRMHRDSLTSCKENELLTHIRKLAVRTENAMVARDVLSKMRQDRDEPVRAFSARLRGQARVCQFVAKCQCPHCLDHDVCVGTDYSDIVVRDQLVLGCADHDLKLDYLTEKGPSASLDEVMAFVEGKESGKLSLQQLAGGSEAAAPISSFRKQQKAVVRQQAPPTPLHTPPCTHCGQSGHGSGRDERSANCPAHDQACAKCGKQGHLGTVCRHPSTSSPRYGQRRSDQPPQRETVTAVFQSLCGVTITLPAEDAVVCNVEDLPNFPGVDHRSETDVSACNAASESSMTAACECPRRQPPPPPPRELPYPAVEENREKLEQWLLSHYKASTFNTCHHQPLLPMEGPPLRLKIDPYAKPVACHKPIDVPIHWRDDVKAGLDQVCRMRVIEEVPIGTPATWCHRMVIAAKKNGKPRRTVDLQALNATSTRETHRTQRPFLQARSVPHGTKKTVCDAWNGYHSVPLHPDDRHLTTFITPWGRYRYRSAPQCYVASGDGFTRRFDEIVAHITNKTTCVDDTLLWADITEQAFWQAVQWLETRGRNGVTQNPDKFVFGKDTVEFAGFEITRTSVKPCSKMLQSIQDFPTPKNITDIRSWFGLVNQSPTPLR